MAVKKTILVDDDLNDRVAEQAKRKGVPWTTMLKLLAREALENAEARERG